MGQNGPEIFSLSQGLNDLFRWSLDEILFEGSTYSALRNQGLYASVQTVDFAQGEIRGQFEPLASAPPAAENFLVVATVPSNGATLEALPASIEITFNRDVLASSVSVASFDLVASGGDGSFADGNELQTNIAATAVSGSAVTLDLTGATGGNDVYQLRIVADGGAPITDISGVVLDGDADGNAGGEFITTFSVAAVVATATLSDVQTQVFTPSCAVSGCHAGAAPSQGMDLSSGAAFSNTVGVTANEVGSLQRINPNDPDNSYLVQKIEGVQAAGSRMPLGQPALSNELIQLVRDWVTDGAQDN